MGTMATPKSQKCFQKKKPFKLLLWTECLCPTPRPPNSCVEALTPNVMVLGDGLWGDN